MANDKAKDNTSNPTVGQSDGRTTGTPPTTRGASDNKSTGSEKATTDSKQTDKKNTDSSSTGSSRAAKLEKEGVPSNSVAVPPQVVSRDELAKDEYSYENGRLEIDRGHPNYIFDNQRNQQAQENTVEVAAGIRNEDGTLKSNHPLADTANPKIVSDNGTGETDEERKNREELAK